MRRQREATNEVKPKRDGLYGTGPDRTGDGRGVIVDAKSIRAL